MEQPIVQMRRGFVVLGVLALLFALLSTLAGQVAPDALHTVYRP